MNILSKFTDFFGLAEEGDMEYEVEATAPARTVQATPQVTPKKKKLVSHKTSYQKVPVQEEKSCPFIKIHDRFTKKVTQRVKR